MTPKLTVADLEDSDEEKGELLSRGRRNLNNWKKLFRPVKKEPLPLNLNWEPSDVTIYFKPVERTPIPEADRLIPFIESQEKLQRDQFAIDQYIKDFHKPVARLPKNWKKLPLYSPKSHKFIFYNIPHRATEAGVKADLERQLQIVCPAKYVVTDVYFVQDVRFEESCNHAIATITSRDRNNKVPILELTETFSDGIYVVGVRCTLFSAETYRTLLIHVSNNFMKTVNTPEEGYKFLEEIIGIEGLVDYDTNRA